MHWMSTISRHICLIGVLALSSMAGGQASDEDLAKMNIEDLMNYEVTSVSKKEQKISRTASAVYVISQEDIRHSGATSIPDLLRMVPGASVAQFSSNIWAIGVRGFNGQFSNTLLVLIDGRAIYTPMFSGVFWDAHEVPLESIERIEVIRGPGASVWGANAVNGVINIITKKASATPGGLITAGVGTYEQGFGRARYGGKIGQSGAYRLTMGGFNRAHFPNPAGQSGQDDWNAVHGGFRLDSSLSPQDSITLEGDAHVEDAGEIVTSILSIDPPLNGITAVRARDSGWNVLSRWEHSFSPRSETSLQAYFDRTNRADTTYGFATNILDLDFQHHIGWGRRQDLVWGVGYRAYSDSVPAGFRFSLSPPSRTTHLFTSFVQDELAILPERLYLTLGSKLERNSYTGLGLQPSARLAWIANAHNMFWASVSRALQTPSRIDRTIRINFAVYPGPGNLPVMASMVGNPQQTDQRLNAVEAGYRATVSDKASIDVAIFYNKYRNLVSVEPLAPFLETDPLPPHLVFPTSFGNSLYGETHGVEVFGNCRVTRRWMVSPSYSFLAMHLHTIPSSHDTTTVISTQGSAPTHQAQLRSHVDLSHGWQWNASAYFVGRLPAQNVSSYTRLDTNVVWQLGEKASVMLAGQNLLKDHHAEYLATDSVILPSLVKRSAYAQFSWWF